MTFSSWNPTFNFHLIELRIREQKIHLAIDLKIALLSYSHLPSLFAYRNKMWAFSLFAILNWCNADRFRFFVLVVFHRSLCSLVLIFTEYYSAWEKQVKNRTLNEAFYMQSGIGLTTWRFFLLLKEIPPIKSSWWKCNARCLEYFEWNTNKILKLLTHSGIPTWIMTKVFYRIIFEGESENKEVS